MPWFSCQQLLLHCLKPSVEETSQFCPVWEGNVWVQEPKEIHQCWVVNRSEGKVERDDSFENILCDILVGLWRQDVV